jgi:hypothetical protein
MGRGGLTEEILHGAGVRGRGLSVEERIEREARLHPLFFTDFLVKNEPTLLVNSLRRASGEIVIGPTPEESARLEAGDEVHVNARRILKGSNGQPRLELRWGFTDEDTAGRRLAVNPDALYRPGLLRAWLRVKAIRERIGAAAPE